MTALLQNIGAGLLLLGVLASGAVAVSLAFLFLTPGGWIVLAVLGLLVLGA